MTQEQIKKYKELEVWSARIRSDRARLKMINECNFKPRISDDDGTSVDLGKYANVVLNLLDALLAEEYAAIEKEIEEI